jgi:hypothetical protein
VLTLDLQSLAVVLRALGSHMVPWCGVMSIAQIFIDVVTSLTFPVRGVFILVGFPAEMFNCERHTPPHCEAHIIEQDAVREQYATRGTGSDERISERLYQHATLL